MNVRGAALGRFNVLCPIMSLPMPLGSSSSGFRRWPWPTPFCIGEAVCPIRRDVDRSSCAVGEHVIGGVDELRVTSGSCLVNGSLTLTVNVRFGPRAQSLRTLVQPDPEFPVSG